MYNKVKQAEGITHHKQKLLMLGTSSISCEMVKYAKSQGIYTIVTDPREPEKSVAKLVADEYWMINTGEIDLLEKKCREEGVTAVICGISEFCLEVCMELCKRLGFPCYCTPEAWHYSRDKEDFKKLCKEVGAPVATDYYLTDALTDDELATVKFPVVVKPVDMSGNRGVSYCYNKEDLIKAWKYARSVSKSSKMIVERMLHGEEWYSSYAFSNGEPRLLALNAMYAQPGEPKFCYTVTTTVSNHVEQYIKEINPYILEVLKRVGCKEGYAWVQAMLDEDGHFYILEMGYRLDGDQMFMPYRDMLGYDIVKELVDMACGKKSSIDDLPPSQEHAYKKCGCGLELWTNKDGILTKIKGLDVMEKTPGVFVECLHHVGDTIIKYRPLANISFTTDTIEEMCELIDKVNKEVAFYNEKGEDTVIKYTDFDYLKRVYAEGLAGK